jgi:quercetin dioxygenase-like cupin family protein
MDFFVRTGDCAEFSPHQDGCPSNPVNIACERGRPFLHLPVREFAALRRRDALYNLVLENHVEPKLLPVRFMPACLAVTALFASASAVGQPAPIRETKGVEISHVESLDLTPWAHDVKGRQLRIRKLVFQPGGVVGLHSHDDRPDASYLVQGELTEYREGGYVKRRPGDTVHTAGKNVIHWVANEGNVPAVLVVVDVFKP